MQISRTSNLITSSGKKMIPARKRTNVDVIMHRRNKPGRVKNSLVLMAERRGAALKNDNR